MQTVYRVYEGTREPHRLAVERTAEVLGRGGLALIPTETCLLYTSGHHGTWNVKERQQVVVPIERMDIKECRAAGIGAVSYTHLRGVALKVHDDVCAVTEIRGRLTPARDELALDAVVRPRSGELFEMCIRDSLAGIVDGPAIDLRHGRRNLVVLEGIA